MSWRCAFVAIVLAAACVSARAQEPAPEALAKRDIGKLCKRETVRYCPAFKGRTPTARNQAICLRPYKMNLSFGCRRAVSTIMQPQQPQE